MKKEKFNAPQLQDPAVRPYAEQLRRQWPALLLKRLFDIVTSLVLLILLALPGLVIALAIRLDSPGPIFYAQTRLTQGGRPFQIYKFRSMRVHADREGSLVTTGDDRRITRIGRRLRRLRLDEIPQLWNILRGDMSFVGTRPEVPRYVEHYSPEMWATLLLPAGLSSEASLRYKDEDRLLASAADPDRVYVEEILPAKMAINLEALRHFSLRSECSVLLRTFGVLLGLERQA